MSEAGGRGASVPRSLDELWTLRTDYEDIPVPQLGGTVLRLYALTGTARAELMGEMSGLAALADVAGADKDPGTVRRVLSFQHRVVGASLGYPEPLWEKVGETLGSQTIEALYEVAARLSGIDVAEQAKEKVRLRRQRSAASGTA